MPTALSRADSDFQYDLGVLFVHGIGNQPRGSTLVDFGTPLVEWIAHRAEQLGGSAIVDRACLTPAGEEPATAELCITNAGSARRWLVAEAWWAESFAIRPFPEVARWMLGVVPWTFGAHFGRRLWRALRSRPTDESRRASAADRAEPSSGTSRSAPAPGEERSRWKRPTETVRWGARVAGAFVALLVGLAISVVLLLLVLALLTLGLIPWNRIRVAIQRLQVRLAATIGDSFVLVGRPVESAAILNRFRRDVGFLSERCRRVAVVGHSQGGAVAALGLQSAASDRVRFLLTFGSGLRKLEELSQLRQLRTFRRGAALTVAGFVMVMLALAMIPGIISLRRELADAAVGLGSFALFGGFGLALLIPGIHDFTAPPEPGHLLELARSFADRGIVWRDLFASADMIPNGPLHESAELLPSSTEVVNQGSIFADHTSYWGNRDEFVTLVAEGLLGYDEPCILPPLEATTVEFLGHRRRRRVRSLRAISWIGAASVIVVLSRYASDWGAIIPWLARFLADRVAALLGAHVALGTAPSGGVWARTVGWLAAVLFAHRLARGAWFGLDRRAAEKPPPYLYGGDFPYFISLAVMVQLVLIGAAWTSGNPPGWYFMVALGAMIVIAIVQSAPDTPAELRAVAGSANADPARADAEPQSAADRMADRLVGLVVLAAAAIGIPGQAIDLVRWTHGRLVQWSGGRYGSWILASLVAVVGFVVAITAAGFVILGVARLIVRRTRARASSEAALK